MGVFSTGLCDPKRHQTDLFKLCINIFTFIKFTVKLFYITITLDEHADDEILHSFLAF